MFKKDFFSKYGDYLVLVLIFAISIVCRSVYNFSTELTPGRSGMYYPLQVRCLFEKGSLGFEDMPLVFWMEALLAKIIIFISNYPVDKSIILACKLINVVIPSLVVVPVFFLAKSISDNQIKKPYLAIIIALSVLNPAILVIFGVDFHKNAIGMLFMFMAIYYLWNYSRDKKYISLAMTVISIILTLLTHFGCFSSLFALLVILTMVTVVYYFKGIIEWLKNSKRRILAAISVIFILIMLPIAVNIFDNQRFSHLTSYIVSPFKLFTNSIFILMLKGEYSFDGPNLLFFTVLNLFSILFLITYFRLRKLINKGESFFFLAMVLWYISLSNPFLNVEIFKRLLFISLIPFTVILIFVFIYLKRLVKIPVAIILSLLLILTVATMGIRKSWISKEEYAELQQLKKIIQQPSSTIVLAYHGLEWWTGWMLHTKTGQLMGIKPDEYQKYSKVLYIIQKSKEGEEKAPIGATLINKGQYFDLYEIYSK